MEQQHPFQDPEQNRLPELGVDFGRIGEPEERPQEYDKSHIPLTGGNASNILPLPHYYMMEGGLGTNRLIGDNNGRGVHEYLHEAPLIKSPSEIVRYEPLTQDYYQFIEAPLMHEHPYMPRRSFIKQSPLYDLSNGNSGSNIEFYPPNKLLQYEGPSVAEAESAVETAQADIDAELASNSSNIAAIMTASTAERIELRAKLAALRSTKAVKEAALRIPPIEYAPPKDFLASKLGSMALHLSGITLEWPQPRNALLEIHSGNLQQAKDNLAAEQGALGVGIVDLMHGAAADRIAAHQRLNALRQKVDTAQFFADIASGGYQAENAMRSRYNIQY